MDVVAAPVAAVGVPVDAEAGAGVVVVGVDPEQFFRRDDVRILSPDVDTESRIRVDPILNRPTRDAMLALYNTAKQSRVS